MQKKSQPLSSEEPVQVFIRVRPDLLKNSGVRTSHSGFDGQKSLTAIDDKSIRISPPDGLNGARKSVPAVDDKIFTYDAIFNTESSQDDVYEKVSQHVRATIQGYNTTIFALGCTGSGKTFTMTGTSSDPGIIPRAISEIFSIIEATAAHEKDVFFYVRLSFVELYNNNFRNLLEFAAKELDAAGKSDNDSTGHIIRNRPTSPTAIHPTIAATRSDKIEVRESQSAGVFLAGHNLRIPVTTAQEAFKLINRGLKNRATGSTQCNDISSRSHAILTLHVESRLGEKSAGGTGESQEASPAELRLGKIHLVDLAGSERVAMSGAEGETLVETQSINLSLTALGDVLSALSRNAAIANHQNHPHKGANRSGPRSPMAGGAPMMVPVPYRNSKLTHLLKDSLGGNSKTIMITTVHTQSEYYHQTMVSLKYASRAKKVKNRSLVNRDVIGDSGIHAVSSEIERLRTRLDARTLEFDRLRGVQLRDARENEDLKNRLQEMQDANSREKAELEAQMSRVIHSQAGELATQRKKLSSLQTALQEELAVSQNKIAEQEKEINWLKRALDESSQAVVQPIEQLERVQRVADAWQIQAKHAQDELHTTNSQLNELKSINSAVSSNLSDTTAANRRLTQQLEECKSLLEKEREETSRLRHIGIALGQELDMSKAALSTAAADKQASDRQKDDLQKSVLRLERELATRTVQEQTVAAEMRRRESEWEANTKRLETDNSKLTKKLTDTVSEIETKLTESVMRSSERILELEELKKAAEEKLRAANKEMDSLKRNFLDIHGSVEQVTKDKDTTIVRLTESLESNEVVRMELYQKFISIEERYKDRSNEVNRLKAKLDDAKEALAAADMSRAQADEEHAAAIKALKASHRSAIEKLKIEHSKQMHELHEHSTVEIVKFRDDISAAVVSQQETLRSKHEEELQIALSDLEQRKSEEMVIAVQQAVEDLTQSHVEAMRRVEETHALAIKEEVRVRVAEAVDRAREEWEEALQADAVEMQRLRDEALTRLRTEMEESSLRAGADLQVAHEDELRQLREQHAMELAAAEKRLQNAIEERIELTVREVGEEKDMEIQEIRAKHFELMEETEYSYEQKIEKLTMEKATIIERHTEYVNRLQDENRISETDLESKYKDQIRVILREHKEAMDDLKRQAAATRGEERLALQTEHEQRVLALQQEVRNAAQQELSDQLDAMEARHAEHIKSLELRARQERETAVIAAVAAERESLEKVHSQAIHQLTAEHKTQQEQMVEAQVQEALAHSHEHFKRSQQAREIALQGEKEMAIKNIRNELAVAQTRELEAAEERYTERLSLNLRSLREELEIGHEEEMSSLRQSLLAQYRAELDHIQTKYSAEIATLTEKHELVLKTRERDIEERIRGQHQRDLSLTFSSHEEQLRSLEMKHKATVSELSNVHRKELDEALASQSQELQNEFKLELAAREEAVTVQHRIALTDSLQNLRTEHENELRQLKAAMANEGMESLLLIQQQHEESLREQKESAARELQRELADLRAKLIDEHESRMSSVLESLEQQTRVTIADLKTQHQQEMATTLTATEEVHTKTLQEELAALRQSLEKSHNAAMEALRDEHVAVVEELERRRSEEIDRLVRDKDESLSDVLSSMRADHEMKLLALQQRYEDDKESLARTHEESLAELRAELEEEFKVGLAHSLEGERHRAERDFSVTLSETLRLQKEEARHSFELLIAEELDQQRRDLDEGFEKTLEERLASQRLELHQDYSETFALQQKELESKHQVAIAELIEKYEGKLKAVVQEASQSHEENILALRDQLMEEALATLAAEKEGFESAILTLRHQHDEALVAMRAEIEASSAKTLQCALEQLEKSQADEVESRVQEALNNVRLHHESEIDDLETEFRNRLTSTLTATEEAHTKTLQEELAALRQSLEKSHNAAMEALRDEHVAVVEELERRRSEEIDRLVRDKDESLSDVLSRVRADHEMKLLELQQRHSEEIAAAVERERSRVEGIRMQELKELRDEMAATNLAFESALVEAEDRHKATLAQSLESLRFELNRAHGDQLVQLEASLRQELDHIHVEEVASRLHEVRSTLEAQHFKVISELEHQHQEDVHRMEAVYKAASSAELGEAQEKGKADLVNLTEQHRIAMSALREELESQRLRMLEAKDVVVAELQQRIVEVEARARGDLSSALSEQLDRLLKHQQHELDGLREEKSEVESALKSELTQLQSTLIALEKTHEDSKVQLELTRARELGLIDAVARLEQQVKEMVEKSERESLATSETVKSLEARLQEQYDAQVNELQRKHVDELAVHSRHHDLHVEDLRLQLESAISSHKREIDHLRREVSSEMSAKWAEEESDLQAKHAQELLLLRDALESARAQLASSAPSEKVAELQKGHDEELTRQLNEMRRQHESDIAHVKEQYSNEILRVNSIHQDEIDSMRIQKERSVEDMKTKLHRLSQDLIERDSRLANLMAEVTSFEEERQRHESRVKSLQVEYQRRIEVTQQSFDDSIVEMTARHAEEIKSVRSALQTSQLRCQALQEDNDNLQVQVASGSTKSADGNETGSRKGDSQQIQALKLSYESEISILKVTVSELEASAKDASSRAEASNKRMMDQLREANEKLEESSREAVSSMQNTVIQLKSKHAADMKAAIDKYSALEARCAELEMQLNELRRSPPKPAVKPPPTDAETQAMRLEYEKQMSLQREQMQSRYLTMLQQHMSTLMTVVKSPDNATSPDKVEEMRARFMSMIENLPDTLRNQLQLEDDAPVLRFSSESHKLDMNSGRDEIQPFIARRHTASGPVGEGGSVVSSIGAEEWAETADHASQTSSTARDSHHSHTHSTYNQTHSQARSQAHHESQTHVIRDHGNGRRDKSQLVDTPLETVTWSGLSSKGGKSTLAGAVGGTQETTSRRHLTEIDQSEIVSRSRRYRQHTNHTDSTRHSHSASTSRQHMQIMEDNHSEITRRVDVNISNTGNSLNTSNRSRGRGIGFGSNWTSYGISAPSSTPIDQLIAAILDGDVQGIRSVVRSRGDSLRSEFWGEIAHTVLPLHRAVSGLHFHGNHKTLVQTLETLVQLGADVTAQDHTGNTVLHKAIQVCTSTSVVDVVKCLLKRGAPCGLANAAKQTPLHSECARVRTATVQVISALLQEGADPNAKMNISLANGNTVLVTPLHLVLQAGAHASNPQVEHAEAGTFGDDSVLNSSVVSVASGHGTGAPSRMRSSGAKCWVKAAHTLVVAGASWNSSMQIAKGHTQLYLLLKSFPPPRDDVHTYRSLLAECLSSCSKENATPLTEDEQGRSALFVLCEQMAGVRQDAYPEASNILKMVLEYSGGSIGGADRSGRTVFDIEDDRESDGRKVSFSCLRAARQLLIQAGTHKDVGGRSVAPETADIKDVSSSSSTHLNRHKQLSTRSNIVT